MNHKSSSFKKTTILQWKQVNNTYYTTEYIQGCATAIEYMSTRVLAVTAMIDHENDDCGEKNSDLLKHHFGAALWALVILHASVQSIDVRRERSLAVKSCRDVWVSYIPIWFIYIKCVGIFKFWFTCWMHCILPVFSFMLKRNSSNMIDGYLRRSYCF